MRSGPSRIKKLAFAGFSLLSVVALDSAFKLFLPLPQEARFAVLTKLEGPNAFERLAPDRRPRNVARPYLLYANTPGYRNAAGAQHDERGYRESERTRRADAERTILVLGGSTTYGAGVERPEEVWTHRLQELMSRRASVEVINAGQPYATSAELLAKYAFKDQWVEHELLIVHTGGNEFLPISFPDYREDYSHVRMQVGQTSGRAERRLLRLSGIARFVWGHWSRGSDFGLYQGRPFSHDRLEPDDVARHIGDPRRYEQFTRNISSIVDLATSQGRKVLIVPFLNNHYEPTKNRSDLQPLGEQVQRYQATMIEALRSLAERKGVDFHEIRRGSVSREHFIDNCHLDAEGQMEKAMAVYRHLSGR